MDRVRPSEYRLYPVLPRSLKRTQSRETIEELGLLRRVIVGGATRTAFGISVKHITSSVPILSPIALTQVAWLLNELSPELSISVGYYRDSTELDHWVWYGDDFAYFYLMLYAPDHLLFPGEVRTAVHGDKESILKLVSGSGLLWIPAAADNSPVHGVAPMTASEALQLAEPVQRSSTSR